MEHLVGGTGQYLFIDFCGSFHVFGSYSSENPAELTGPLLLETPPLPQTWQSVRFRNSNFTSLLDTFDRTFMWPTIKKRTKKVWRDYASTNICLTRRHDWSSTPPSSLFFDFFLVELQSVTFAYKQLGVNWLCALLWDFLGGWIRYSTTSK